jgi:hypothetical protein
MNTIEDFDLITLKNRLGYNIQTLIGIYFKEDCENHKKKIDEFLKRRDNQMYQEYVNDLSRCIGVGFSDDEREKKETDFYNERHFVSAKEFVGFLQGGNSNQYIDNFLKTEIVPMLNIVSSLIGRALNNSITVNPKSTATDMRNEIERYKALVNHPFYYSYITPITSAICIYFGIKDLKELESGQSNKTNAEQKANKKPQNSATIPQAEHTINAPQHFDYRYNLKSIYNRLIKGGFIPKETKYSNFQFVFCGKKDGDFKPLEWKGTVSLLAYFIDKMFAKTTVVKKWKTTADCFAINEKEPNINTLKTASAKQRKYNTHPHCYKKIDKIIKGK